MTEEEIVGVRDEVWLEAVLVLGGLEKALGCLLHYPLESRLGSLNGVVETRGERWEAILYLRGEIAADAILKKEEEK